ncbi:MAG TPA: GAF domain-containing protein [Terriglobales bacterium]|nr:GAF domain-containing protein [Terriglobales bacterium]
MGGSLLAHDTATVITDEKMRSVVAELLGPNALGRKPATPVEAPANPGPRLVARSAESAPGKIPVRSEHSPDYRVVNGSLVHLDSPIRLVLDRAIGLTDASGSALALVNDGRLQCHASMGSGVPELGAPVSTQRGLSGLSVRTGKAYRCDRVTGDPYVDLQACRSLGIQSLVVAPLVHLQQVLGILEVLSTQPCAFDDHDVATVQFLASMMVMILTKRDEKDVTPSVLAASSSMVNRRTSALVV